MRLEIQPPKVSIRDRFSIKREYSNPHQPSRFWSAHLKTRNFFTVSLYGEVYHGLLSSEEGFIKYTSQLFCLVHMKLRVGRSPKKISLNKTLFLMITIITLIITNVHYFYDTLSFLLGSRRFGFDQKKSIFSSKDCLWINKLFWPFVVNKISIYHSSCETWYY